MITQYSWVIREARVLTPSYVAGLFDGEGSVGLYESNNTFSFRSQMVQTVAPVTLQIWNELQARWGGNLNFGRSLSGRERMNWQVGQMRAARFLATIRPWLIIKAEQVDVALDWLHGHEPPKRDPATGRMLPRTADELIEARRVSLLLKELKRA